MLGAGEPKLCSKGSGADTPAADVPCAAATDTCYTCYFDDTTAYA